MKKNVRSLIALFLAVLMMASLSVTAFAEEPYTYPDGQFYEADESQVYVYTVQIAAGPNIHGAERLRTELLDKGFDCFIYEADGLYRIMCGKFADIVNATSYCALIQKKTEREDPYISNAYLPQSAIDEFNECWKKDELIVGKVRFNGWETPTGPFVDMTSNTEETTTLYTVQYSQGTNFKAAEMRRDELIGMGFDGYVVKIHGCYLVMAGAFENREDARALRSEIRVASNRWDSSVPTMVLPVSLLG